MARTLPRPRWREKNVLDIPFYRTPFIDQAISLIEGVLSVIEILRQQCTSEDAAEAKHL